MHAYPRVGGGFYHLMARALLDRTVGCGVNNSHALRFSRVDWAGSEVWLCLLLPFWLKHLLVPFGSEGFAFLLLTGIGLLPPRSLQLHIGPSAMDEEVWSFAGRSMDNGLGRESATPPQAHPPPLRVGPPLHIYIYMYIYMYVCHTEGPNSRM